MMTNIQFPISPWVNNYVIIEPPSRERKKIKSFHSYHPPTPAQTMIAYTYLEKLANQTPDKVEYANDSFSFVIKDDEVFKTLSQIITEPIAKTIILALKEYDLLHFEFLPEELLSTPTYMYFDKTVVEPGFRQPPNKEMFVIKCKKFSDKNPYTEKDLIITDLCIKDKSQESPASFVLKVLDLILHDKEETNNVELWYKIHRTIEVYLSGYNCPIILLILVYAIFLYKPLAFFYLSNQSLEFYSVFRLANTYNGTNPGKCREKAGIDYFVNISGLRGGLM